ncbi:MAG: hypothetical protein ACRDNS_11595, partial [Trebonia sp.]
DDEPLAHDVARTDTEQPIVDCVVAGVPADLMTVEALARLQLAAHRKHCTVRLRGASPELLELLAVLGLGDVLPA